VSQRYLLRPVLVEQQHRWDAFVSESSSGHLLQCWGWGELKASADWHPLRLALWDTERQQMVAAAQILRRTFARLPLQAGHLAYIPKGPVLDWSNPALADIAPTFFSQLHMFLRKGGALALQVELPQQANEPGSDKTDQCMHTLHFQPVQAIQPLRTILLDLTLGEDTLLAQMKEKWRYNIRLAGRKGVRVRVARTSEEVRAWYTLLQTTAIRDNFDIHTLDYYLRAWRIFDPRNQVRLFLAEYQDHLLAGIFVGLMAKQAIYLYGASSNENRQLMPNYLLQWEAIRWAKREGATSYDFWGIPATDNESEPMAGVYRFKSGWGGKVIRFLGNYEHIYRPLAMRIVRKGLVRYIH
jgi:peptidoglycan pentaglycine glycine transferase (the first glycine)